MALYFPNQLTPVNVQILDSFNSWSSWVLRLMVYLKFARYEAWRGYYVDAARAVAILAVTQPTPAEWWRRNYPRLIKLDMRFLFPGTCCSVVQEDGGVEKTQTCYP